MASADEFLDLACLTYSGNDAPERRAQARALLTNEPSLPRDSIWVAAATADIEALEATLTATPVDLNRRGGPRDWCPIHYMCFSRVLAEGADAPRALELLLARGADPAASFAIGSCTLRALTGAIGFGEGGLLRQPPHANWRQLAEQLLAAGAPANDPQAVYNRSLAPGDDWLELLIEHGLGAEDEIDWDMNVKPQPRTLDFLLCGAAEHGLVPRVELLLRAGADPNTTSPYDRRHVLVRARLGRCTEVVEHLERSGSESPELDPVDRYCVALAELDREAARGAIAEDASVIDSLGSLADVAGRGFDDATAMAIELGADVDRTDRNGATPLHRAAIGGHVSALRVLLAAGADASVRERHYNATPLDWARHGGQREIVRVLEGE